MTGEKGFHAEELLRNYFNSLGYYVTRGVLFKFRDFDVTDIDFHVGQIVKVETFVQRIGA